MPEPTTRTDLAIGLVGCGAHMTGTLVPALRTVDGIRIVGTCDLDLTRAQRAAAPFAGAEACQEFERLLELDPQAVVMAGPPQMHYELGVQAIDSRVAVFVEKPPAPTVVELVDLTQRAAAAGVVAVVGHNFRHSETWGLCRRLADSEAFGRTIALHTSYLASAPRGERWGLDALRSFLLTHVVHPVDLAIATFGEPTETFAHVNEITEGGLVLTAHLDFMGQGAATVLAATAAPNLQLDIRLIGDKSHYIRADGLRRVVSSLVSERSSGAFRPTSTWDLRTLGSGELAVGYQGELQAFVDAVRGERAATPTLMEALATYRTLEMLERRVLEGTRRGA